MIQIESVEIEELRGIRKLTLTMDKRNFVVAGPNGSGKSGVVDAIEFALTGEMTRLTGKGTAGIKLATHGPHVDKRDYPDSSIVRLRVYIPTLGRSATLTRNVKRPKDLIVEPDVADVRAVLATIAEHPEITLSRREIIKFILTEATQRSRDVQTLLKLDDIDQTRGTLKTTQNKLGDQHTAASSQVAATAGTLCRHLDLPALTSQDLLNATNARRAILGLAPIGQLESDTSLAAGIDESARKGATGIDKESALRDLKGLRGLVEAGLEAPTGAAISDLVEGLKRLEGSPGLLEAIRRRSFIQTGLDLVDSPACPLCDLAWDMSALRSHLEEKLQMSREADDLQQALLRRAREITAEVVRIRSLLQPVERIAVAAGATTLGKMLDAWNIDLGSFAGKLNSVSDILPTRSRLETGWAAQPVALLDELDALMDQVTARPDESATVAAQTFLVVAQERLEAWRRAKRDEQAAKAAAEAGRVAYKAYCDVAEAKLTSLYEQVEEEFSGYYRELNGDDEGDFTAKLSPENGKLDLTVDFHKRGMFPPGAYHSEGHQDGMGVCIYLALVKHLLTDDFTLAVLDDVVMSVDSGHRKQFCKLLKKHFPGTQFVITTHDKIWCQQMRSEGLVTAKSTMSFRGWTVDTGPIAEENPEVWEEISADLAKGRVSDAAGTLRRHLEFCSGELADLLGARVPHRLDGNHELGDLLPAVLARQNELLGKAARSAQDWGDDDAKERVKQRQADFALRAAASNVEQWAVNSAVHYNTWANFSEEDFKPVVVAFKQLLDHFRCSGSGCHSWVQVSPRRGTPEMLSCTCNAVSFNLRLKK